jgi:methionine-gamma-lyase
MAPVKCCRHIVFFRTMVDPLFETLAVHAGEDRELHYGAASVPIYPASLYSFRNADEGARLHAEEQDGYFYGRLGNPTQQALEKAVAQIEDAEAALAFASGMAAISGVILTLVRLGEHIVAPRSMYSTTTNLLNYLKESFGIETTYITDTSAEGYQNAVRENTRLFWIETPSNPTLQITDIRAVCSETTGILKVVDNTFATPYNQRPLRLGADISVHSATKYLGGHSDLTAGVIAGRGETVAKVRKYASKLLGGNIAPHTAWLVLTLALRMERHNANAFALANMLARHSGVAAVHYPGLASHEGREVAASQMRGFGGMIGLDLGSYDAAKAFVDRVELCMRATSLGGVETIVQHSASMTHASLSREEREQAGISDGLLRLSVGIENVEDLKKDIFQAIGNK